MRLLAVIVLVFAGGGCFAPTSSVVREFGADGVLLKESVSSESVIRSFSRVADGRTVVVWENGWTGSLLLSAATLENPTPTLRFGAGRLDRGAILALPGERHWAEIGGIVRASETEADDAGHGSNQP